jgi:hypothetical protein
MLSKTKTAKSKGRLFEQVMKIMEEKSTIIDLWKNGILSIQEEAWRVIGQDNFYVETIRQYELEQIGLKINHSGVIEKQDKFRIFHLEHKPSKWEYSLCMVKFSNGLIDTAMTLSANNGYSGSPLTLPYHYDPLYNVDSYEGLINQIYSEAQKRIECYFGKNPKIKKGLYAELDKQMDHDGFGGLNWHE